MTLYDVAIEPIHPRIVQVEASSSTEAGLLAVLTQADDNWRVADVTVTDETPITEEAPA